MAQIPLNYGTVIGDGQGDFLFNIFEDAEANFTDLYTRVAFKDVIQEFSRSQNFHATTGLTTSGTLLTWDVAVNQVTVFDTTEDFTLLTPNNQKAGGTYIMFVQQGATPYQISFGSFYKFSGSHTLTQVADALDIMTFVSDGTYMHGVMQNNFVST